MGNGRRSRGNLVCAIKICWICFAFPQVSLDRRSGSLANGVEQDAVCSFVCGAALPVNKSHGDDGLLSLAGREHLRRDQTLTRRVHMYRLHLGLTTSVQSEILQPDAANGLNL